MNGPQAQKETKQKSEQGAGLGGSTRSQVTALLLMLGFEDG